jgi:hypothetical protein
MGIRRTFQEKLHGGGNVFFAVPGNPVEIALLPVNLADIGSADIILGRWNLEQRTQQAQ